MKATTSAPPKLPRKRPAPVAQDAAHGHARAAVQQRQRRQHEDPGEQVETHQVEHHEAHRKQHGTHQRRAGLHGHRDREHRGKSQDRAGHEAADQGVAGGHEDLRFAGVHHLGDELGGDDVGHVGLSEWQ